jgi:hypothetical protein
MISFDVPTVCEREFIEKNCARPPKAQDSRAQLRADPGQAQKSRHNIFLPRDGVSLSLSHT